MVKRRGPPSQGWRTFLPNHAPDIAAMDLFVVPTIGFDLLYALIVVRLDRRGLVWITAQVTSDDIKRYCEAEQVSEAGQDECIRENAGEIGKMLRSNSNWTDLTIEPSAGGRFKFYKMGDDYGGPAPVLDQPRQERYRMRSAQLHRTNGERPFRLALSLGPAGLERSPR
jgi:hypothetical protein